jgi:ADP-heptose:LPS heptosyltransferase
MARSANIPHLLQRYTLVDNVLLISAGPFRRAASLVNMLGRRYDVVMMAAQLTRKWAFLVKVLFRPKTLAGEFSEKQWPYSHGLRTEKGKHRVIVNIGIARSVFPDMAYNPRFVAVKSETVDALNRSKVVRHNLKYAIGIHPGSEPKTKQKRYPAEMYKNLVIELIKTIPECEVLIFLGPGETDLKKWFIFPDQRVQIVENEKFEEVMEAVSKLDLLITGDTSLAHVGSFFKTPTVVIAGPTDIRTTGPFNEKAVILKTDRELSCQPCYGTPLYTRCPYDIACLRSIPESKILKAALEALSPDKSHAS